MDRSSSNPSSPSSSQVLTFIAFILSVAVLYFAREVLIPLALAMLLTFLLTPIAKLLENWRLGRLPAVLIALVLSLSAIGGIGWMVSNQLLDVINQLPGYKDNIRRKLETIHGPQGGILTET